MYSNSQGYYNASLKANLIVSVYLIPPTQIRFFKVAPTFLQDGSNLARANML